MFTNGFKRVKDGFTLAEVLITLGIIGVVAAMTMPTLMNATNGAQYKTAYKKALSVISQAIVLNLALDDYDLGDVKPNTDAQSVYTLLSERMNHVNRLDGTFKGPDGESDYAPTVQGETADSANNYTFFFNDGIMFTFPKAAEACKESNVKDQNSDRFTADRKCFGFIDVNGTKAPNTETVCDEEDATGDACIVSQPKDIYPVVFYDQGIYPATDAGRAVLYKK